MSEPCLCGADDCPRCYPFTWDEPDEYYDEDGNRLKNKRGEDPRVTITGTEEFRRDIWKNKEKYIGKMIEYKAMVIGMKDFPRHPTFLRFREDRD